MGGYERKTMKLLYGTFGAISFIAPCVGAILGGGNPCLIAGFCLTLIGGGGVGWLLCECASRADVAISPESPKDAANLRHSARTRSPRVRSTPTSRPVRDGLPA